MLPASLAQIRPSLSRLRRISHSVQLPSQQLHRARPTKTPHARLEQASLEPCPIPLCRSHEPKRLRLSRVPARVGQTPSRLLISPLWTLQQFEKAILTQISIPQQTAFSRITTATRLLRGVAHLHPTLLVPAAKHANLPVFHPGTEPTRASPSRYLSTITSTENHRLPSSIHRSSHYFRDKCAATATMVKVCFAIIRLHGFCRA